MKTIIKNYKHPQVNPNLLNQILQIQKRKNILLVLTQYIAFSLIFTLFIANQVNLNIEYYSIFASFWNISFLIQIVFQVIIWVIHFFMNNILLISWLFLLSFISNIYSIQE